MVSGTAPHYITPGGPFPASVQVFPMSAAGTDPTTVTAPTPSGLFTYYPNPTLIAAAPAFIPPATLPRVITLTGRNFMDPANRDVFLGSRGGSVPQVEVRNAGLAHPATYPAGEYDQTFNLNVLNNTTAVFVMPVPPKGDSYDVTIFTPNGDRICTGGSSPYSFTLASAFTVNSEFDCTDTIDNDVDGFADCLDPDCEAVAPCP